jgi:hypothetical protein
MNRHTWRIAHACSLAFGFGPLLGCGGHTPMSPLPAVVAAESLTETDVLPHTAGPLTPGRNYVYCATFQMAWDELRDGIFVGPIKLSGSPPMADVLNAGSAKGLDLDEASYLARAGLVKDGVLNEIRRDVRRRFPEAGFEVPDAGQDAIVAYAFLQKTLPFAETFDRLDEPLAFQHERGTAPVVAFGFRGDLKEGAPRTYRLLNQVRVLSYATEDDFVLRLRTQSTNDSMVLAKVPAKATLAATIDSVHDRIKGHDDDFGKRLGSNETLVVPVVALGVLRRFSELEGHEVLNTPWKEQGYFVAVALQGIRFRLDETGAQLSSMARDEKAKSAQTSRPQPRKLIVNKPFLLYLQRAGAEQPYLALWIATPELLTPATP